MVVRHRDRGVGVLFLVEDGHRLPVVPEASVEGVPRGVAGHPVGAPQRHMAEVGELRAREVLRDLVVNLFRFESEGLRAREELAHLPDELVGSRIDEARARREIRLDGRRRRLLFQLPQGGPRGFSLRDSTPPRAARLRPSDSGEAKP